MKKGFKDLVAEAEGEVDALTPHEVAVQRETAGTVLIDLRDVRELQREGRIPGSVHVPRGMLEFWIDPDSPYHKELFSTGQAFIFYCNKGWRSALAAKTAQDMGLPGVAHLAGGLEAWQAAGLETEPYERKSG